MQPEVPGPIMPPMAGWPKPPIGGLKFIVITSELWITRKQQIRQR